MSILLWKWSRNKWFRWPALNVWAFRHLTWILWECSHVTAIYTLHSFNSHMITFKNYWLNTTFFFRNVFIQSQGENNYCLIVWHLSQSFKLSSLRWVPLPPTLLVFEVYLPLGIVWPWILSAQPAQYFNAFMLPPKSDKYALAKTFPPLSASIVWKANTNHSLQSQKEH